MKKLIFLFTVVFLVGCSKGATKTEETKIVAMEGKSVFYETVESLEESSSIIALITPTGEKENKFILEGADIVELGVTVSEVKIDKVFKGEVSGDIKLIEEYFTNTKTKEMFVMDNYAPLRAGEQYLVFLNDVGEDTHEELKGSYYILGTTEGIIPVTEDGRDQNIKFIEENGLGKFDSSSPVYLIQQEAIAKYVE